MRSMDIVITFAAIFVTIRSAACVSNHRCSHINYKINDNSECPESSVCKKTFNISYIQMKPYSPTDGIENYVKICCGHCSRINVLNVFNDSLSITPKSINTSHFLYPFLGSINDQFVNGYRFIPVMHVPKTYYITVLSKVTVFQSLFQLYPLVTVCLLLGLLAGFICWAIECRDNQSIFPKSFLIGWFEGFWWAFVTMTTVGYGDKSPRTILGRLFSIVWILTGITACGILTALLTTKLMEANTQKPPNIYGSKVGVLQDRLYDALVVNEYGGIVDISEAADFDLAIYELVTKLHNKTVDGILLDGYTLWSIIEAFNEDFNEDFNGNRSMSHEDRKRKEEIQFHMQDTLKTSVSYNNEVLAYGILVRNEEDYDYFRDVIRGNRFNLQNSLEYFWNIKKNTYNSSTGVG